jgi:hypothetical protein
VTGTEVKPGGWILQLTCCGRDDGTVGRRTWQEADELRESYVAADGHERSAIIVAGFEE